MPKGARSKTKQKTLDLETFKYVECPHIHFKADTIDRGILSRAQHLNLLSTPKGYRWDVKKQDDDDEDGDDDIGPARSAISICRDRPRVICGRRIRKPEKTYIHNFLAEIWALLTPEMIDRLKEMLMKEFGMTPMEADVFIVETRQKTLKRSITTSTTYCPCGCKSIYATRIKRKPICMICPKNNLSPNHNWVKEFANMVSSKFVSYAASIICAKRSKRHYTVAKSILSRLCIILDENCTLLKPKTRVQKALVVLADTIALLLLGVFRDKKSSVICGAAKYMYDTEICGDYGDSSKDKDYSDVCYDRTTCTCKKWSRPKTFKDSKFKTQFKDSISWLIGQMDPKLRSIGQANIIKLLTKIAEIVDHEEKHVHISTPEPAQKEGKTVTEKMKKSSLTKISHDSRISKSEPDLKLKEDIYDIKVYESAVGVTSENRTDAPQEIKDRGKDVHFTEDIKNTIQESTVEEAIQDIEFTSDLLDIMSLISEASEHVSERMQEKLDQEGVNLQGDQLVQEGVLNQERTTLGGEKLHQEEASSTRDGSHGPSLGQKKPEQEASGLEQDKPHLEELALMGDEQDLEGPALGQEKPDLKGPALGQDKPEQQGLALEGDKPDLEDLGLDKPDLKRLVSGRDKLDEEGPASGHDISGHEGLALGPDKLDQAEERSSLGVNKLDRESPSLGKDKLDQEKPSLGRDRVDENGSALGQDKLDQVKPSPGQDKLDQEKPSPGQDKLDQEGPVAGRDKSNLEGSALGQAKSNLEGSALEQDKSNLESALGRDKLDQEGPVAGRDKSNVEGPALGQDKLDQEGPVARRDKSNLEGPALGRDKSNLEGSALEQDKLDHEEPTLEQDKLDQEGPTLEQDKLDQEGPIAGRDKSILEEPFLGRDKPDLEGLASERDKLDQKGTALRRDKLGQEELTLGDDKLRPEERSSLRLDKSDQEGSSLRKDKLDQGMPSFRQDKLDQERLSLGEHLLDEERPSVGQDKLAKKRSALRQDKMDPERLSLERHSLYQERPSLGQDKLDREGYALGQDKLDLERLSLGRHSLHQDGPNLRQDHLNKPIIESPPKKGRSADESHRIKKHFSPRSQQDRLLSIPSQFPAVLPSPPKHSKQKTRAYRISGEFMDSDFVRAPIAQKSSVHKRQETPEHHLIAGTHQQLPESVLDHSGFQLEQPISAKQKHISESSQSSVNIVSSEAPFSESERQLLMKSLTNLSKSLSEEQKKESVGDKDHDQTKVVAPPLADMAQQHHKPKKLSYRVSIVSSEKVQHEPVMRYSIAEEHSNSSSIIQTSTTPKIETVSLVEKLETGLEHHQKEHKIPTFDHFKGQEKHVSLQNEPSMMSYRERRGSSRHKEDRSSPAYRVSIDSSAAITFTDDNPLTAKRYSIVTQEHLRASPMKLPPAKEVILHPQKEVGLKPLSKESSKSSVHQIHKIPQRTESEEDSKWSAKHHSSFPSHTRGTWFKYNQNEPIEIATAPTDIDLETEHTGRFVELGSEIIQTNGKKQSASIYLPRKRASEIAHERMLRSPTYRYIFSQSNEIDLGKVNGQGIPPITSLKAPKEISLTRNNKLQENVHSLLEESIYDSFPSSQPAKRITSLNVQNENTGLNFVLSSPNHSLKLEQGIEKKRKSLKDSNKTENAQAWRDIPEALSNTTSKKGDVLKEVTQVRPTNRPESFSKANTIDSQTVPSKQIQQITQFHPKQEIDFVSASGKPGQQPSISDIVPLRATVQPFKSLKESVVEEDRKWSKDHLNLGVPVIPEELLQVSKQHETGVDSVQHLSEQPMEQVQELQKEGEAKKYSQTPTYEETAEKYAGQQLSSIFLQGEVKEQYHQFTTRKQSYEKPAETMQQVGKQEEVIGQHLPIPIKQTSVLQKDLEQYHLVTSDTKPDGKSIEIAWQVPRQGEIKTLSDIAYKQLQEQTVLLQPISNQEELSEEFHAALEEKIIVPIQQITLKEQVYSAPVDKLWVNKESPDSREQSEKQLAVQEQTRKQEEGLPKSLQEALIHNYPDQSPTILPEAFEQASNQDKTQQQYEKLDKFYSSPSKGAEGAWTTKHSNLETKLLLEAATEHLPKAQKSSPKASPNISMLLPLPSPNHVLYKQKPSVQEYPDKSTMEIPGPLPEITEADKSKSQDFSIISYESVEKKGYDDHEPRTPLVPTAPYIESQDKTSGLMVSRLERRESPKEESHILVDKLLKKSSIEHPSEEIAINRQSQEIESPSGYVKESVKPFGAKQYRESKIGSDKSTELKIVTKTFPKTYILSEVKEQQPLGQIYLQDNSKDTLTEGTIIRGAFQSRKYSITSKRDKLSPSKTEKMPAGEYSPIVSLREPFQLIITNESDERLPSNVKLGNISSTQAYSEVAPAVSLYEPFHLINTAEFRKHVFEVTALYEPFQLINTDEPSFNGLKEILPEQGCTEVGSNSTEFEMDLNVPKRDDSQQRHSLISYDKLGEMGEQSPFSQESTVTEVELSPKVMVPTESSGQVFIPSDSSAEELCTNKPEPIQKIPYDGRDTLRSNSSLSPIALPPPIPTYFTPQEQLNVHDYPDKPSIEQFNQSDLTFLPTVSYEFLSLKEQFPPKSNIFSVNKLSRSDREKHVLDQIIKSFGTTEIKDEGFIHEHSVFLEVVAKRLEDDIFVENNRTKNAINEVALCICAWMTDTLREIDDEIQLNVIPVSKGQTELTYHVKRNGSAYDIHTISDSMVKLKIDSNRAPTVSHIPKNNESLNQDELRNWARWAADVVTIAEQWADWIDETCIIAKKKTLNKNGKSHNVKVEKEYKQWLDQVNVDANEWRKNKTMLKNIAKVWDEKVELSKQRKSMHF